MMANKMIITLNCKMIANKSVTYNLLRNLFNLRNERRHGYGTTCIKQYDIAVVGGGIVGASSARAILLRHPHLKLALLEKENDFAVHQSGNNSGVIHAGIYYKPGSLKAKLCVKGMSMMYKYCDEKGVKYSKCGKLIVATERHEVPRLLDLYDRALKNNVPNVRLVDASEIRQIEPHCQGIQGIWSPNTGIVDYGLVTQCYVKDIRQGGGSTYLNFEVKEFVESDDPEYPILLSNKGTSAIAAKYVLTCCGLHSDTVAMLTGCSEDPKIIPFRGEYLFLKQEKGSTPLVKTNIYPVPDPRFPFLGVHITPTINNRIILGPNAILAFSREGYKWTDINLNDLKDIITFSGFRKLAMKYAGFGIKEIARSLITPLQVTALQKFVKEITYKHVEPGTAGVRAQAMGKDGTLVEDFVFDSQPGTGNIGTRVLHCRNAPSPGATSSLAIAEMIADKMQELMKIENKRRVTES